jgi:hypothetical protein
MESTVPPLHNLRCACAETRSVSDQRASGPRWPVDQGPADPWSGSTPPVFSPEDDGSELRVLEDCRLSVLAGRRARGPRGARGGEDGARGRTLVTVRSSP